MDSYIRVIIWNVIHFSIDFNIAYNYICNHALLVKLIDKMKPSNSPILIDELNCAGWENKIDDCVLKDVSSPKNQNCDNSNVIPWVRCQAANNNYNSMIVSSSY